MEAWMKECHVTKVSPFMKLKCSVAGQSWSPQTGEMEHKPRYVPSHGTQKKKNK